MSTKSVITIVFLSFAFAQSFCTVMPKYEIKQPIEDDNKLAQILEVHNQLYPESFQAKHRIVVDIRGDVMDLTGAIMYRRPNQFYASAYVEAGSALFTFGHTDDERTMLLKHPKSLSKQSMDEGVISDINHIYSQHRPDGGRLVAKNTVGRTYVFPRERGFVYELTFANSGQLLRSVTALRGEVRRRITFHDYKKPEGWDKALPHIIKIRNYRFDYEMTISLLELTDKLPANFDQLFQNI